MDELIAAFYGVGVAAAALLTMIFGVLLKFAPDIIRTWLERNKLISLEQAGNIATKAVQERSWGADWSAESKEDAARQIVKSLVPSAVKTTDVSRVSDVVKAGVQNIRMSVPTNTVDISQGLDIHIPKSPALPNIQKTP